MLKVVLWLTGFVLLSLGVQDLYLLSNSTAQATVRCDQFASRPPRALWVRVTGCEIDYIGAGFRESNGEIQELLFPVRPTGRPRTQPAALVAATRDREALAIAQATIGGGRTPDQEQFLVMMLKIVTALKASREIEGLARAGLLERLRTRRLLSGLSTPVAPDAVLIDLHARPRLAVPAVLTGAGVSVLLIAAVLTLGRRGARTPAAGRAEVAVAHETAPPETASGLSSPPRLRVMLLALPPDADAAMIEKAPPLGDLADVRDTIERLVQGMRLDPQNRGAVGDRDYVIAIDLGRDPVVHTAVVDARGARAAAELRRLISETGWRAYAPKMGRFIDLDSLVQLASRS